MFDRRVIKRIGMVSGSRKEWTAGRHHETMDLRLLLL